MATTMNGPMLRALTEGEKFNALERYVLRRAHPFMLMFDIVGVMWSTYYLWLGEWRIALGIIIVERLICMSFLNTVNYRSMADTLLGRIALLHLHPVNLAIQGAGIVFTVWSIWMHSTQGILGGLTAIILGHAFGWSKVDDRLKRTEIAMKH